MRVTKIIEIVDTREYEECPDGRYRPVPGSGCPHSCDRCGRSHEVHARVEIESGGIVVIGTGCAKSDDIVTKKDLQSAAAKVRQEKIGIVRRKKRPDPLADLEAKEAKYRELCKTIPAPEAEWIDGVPYLEGVLIRRYAHPTWDIAVHEAQAGWVRRKAQEGAAFYASDFLKIHQLRQKAKKNRAKPNRRIA